MIWAAAVVLGIFSKLLDHPILSHYIYTPSGKHFLYNNDPKCTANMVRAVWMEKTHLRTLLVTDWPPQISDINIIEAVRDHLDREQNKMQPRAKEEL